MWATTDAVPCYKLLKSCLLELAELLMVCPGYEAQAADAVQQAAAVALLEATLSGNGVQLGSVPAPEWVALAMKGASFNDSRFFHTRNAK